MLVILQVYAIRNATPTSNATMINADNSVTTSNTTAATHAHTATWATALIRASLRPTFFSAGKTIRSTFITRIKLTGATFSAGTQSIISPNGWGGSGLSGKYCLSCVCSRLLRSRRLNTGSSSEHRTALNIFIACGWVKINSQNFYKLIKVQFF